MGSVGTRYLTCWWLDLVITVTLLALGFFFHGVISSLGEVSQWGANFISAALAFAGVVLTAAVFVATMTLSSNNPLLQTVTAKLNEFLSKNWLTIIGQLIATAAILVVLLAFVSVGPTLAVAFAMALLAGVVLSAIRTLKIFSFYLLVEEENANMERKVISADRMKREAEEAIRQRVTGN